MGYLSFQSGNTLFGVIETVLPTFFSFNTGQTFIIRNYLTRTNMLSCAVQICWNIWVSEFFGLLHGNWEFDFFAVFAECTNDGGCEHGGPFESRLV